MLNHIDQKVRHWLLALLLLLAILYRFLYFLNIDLGFFLFNPFRVYLVGLSAFLGLRFLVKLPGLAREALRSPLLFLKRTPLAAFFVILLFAWMVYGGLWIVFPHVSDIGKTEFFGVFSLFLFAFCFFSLVEDRSDLEFAGSIVVYACLFIAVYGLIEVIFSLQLPGSMNFYTFEQEMKMGRFVFAPTTGYTNTNDYASALSIGIVITQYRFLCAETWKEARRRLLEITVMLLPTVLISSTIFNTVFLLLSMMLVVFTFLFRQADAAFAKKKILLYIVAVGLYFLVGRVLVREVVVGLNQLYFNQRVAAYVASHPGLDFEPKMLQNPLDAFSATVADQLKDFRGGTGTIHIRLTLIAFGIQTFLHYPLFGAGPGNFRTLINMRPDVLQHTRKIDVPHNFYLELLSQYGLLFFIPFAALFLKCLHVAHHTLRQEMKNHRPGLATLAFMMLVDGAIIAVLPSSIIQITSLWIVFFIPIGIVSLEHAEKKLIR